MDLDPKLSWHISQVLAICLSLTFSFQNKKALSVEVTFSLLASSVSHKSSWGFCLKPKSLPEKSWDGSKIFCIFCCSFNFYPAMNVREHLRWVKRVCGHCCISPWRPFARGNKVCQTVVYSPTSYKMRRKGLPLHEGMKAKTKKWRHISSGIYFQPSKWIRSRANWLLASCICKVFPELHCSQDRCKLPQDAAFWKLKLQL